MFPAASGMKLGDSDSDMYASDASEPKLQDDGKEEEGEEDEEDV